MDTSQQQTNRSTRRTRNPGEWITWTSRLVLAGFVLLAACATTPREEALPRMTGFEREMLAKLEKLRKGMTPAEAQNILGPANDGSLFQDAARYWILSTRKVVVRMKTPMPMAPPFSRGLPAPLSDCVVEVNRDVTRVEGLVCVVGSTDELNRTVEDVKKFVPADALIDTPYDEKERDAVAKLVFSGGKLASAYLIHPASSKRGAFYYVVIE